GRMTVLTVRERDRLTIGSARQELSERHAAGLADLARLLPRRTFSWEHQAIRFGPYCGVLQVGDLTIEILPKIATRLGNDAQSRGILITMLHAVGELSAAAIGTAALGLQKFHLLDVFIIDFCQRIHELLRRGAIRTYEPRRDNLTMVRGRVQLSED